MTKLAGLGSATLPITEKEERNVRAHVLRSKQTFVERIIEYMKKAKFLVEFATDLLASTRKKRVTCLMSSSVFCMALLCFRRSSWKEEKFSAFPGI
jgi:hypothetical protein